MIWTRLAKLEVERPWFEGDGDGEFVSIINKLSSRSFHKQLSCSNFIHTTLKFFSFSWLPAACSLSAISQSVTIKVEMLLKKPKMAFSVWKVAAEFLPSFVYNNKLILTEEKSIWQKFQVFECFTKKFVKMTADFGEIWPLSKSIYILCILEVSEL